MSTPEVGATELPPVSVPVDVVMGDVGHGDTGVDAAILNGAPPTTGSGKDDCLGSTRGVSQPPRRQTSAAEAKP